MNRCLLPFQQDCLVTIDSALDLFEKLKDKQGISYPLTSRLKPLFKYWLYHRQRIIILGQSADYHIITVNTTSVEISEGEKQPAIMSQ